MRWQDPPGVHAWHDVFTCAVQLRADGSGAFPLPQQPPGELFTSPPEQLLAALNPGRASPTAPRDAFPAASPAAGSCDGGATPLNGAATHSAPGAPAIVPVSAPVDVPVSGPVAPIGDFLTVDPAAEGPLPAAALNLARPQGSGPRASAAKTCGPAVHSNEGGAAAAACSRAQANSEPVLTGGCGATSGERSADFAGAPAAGTASEASEAAPAAGTASEISEAAPATWTASEAPTVVPAACHASEAVSTTENGQAPGATGQPASPAALNTAADPWTPYWLPESELAARGAVMDIVTVRAP